MAYQVKEIYYTLQGEGAQAGRAAVFLRFAGCNLWTGREADRATAVCQFCDTDFFGTDGDNGGRYASPIELVRMVVSEWPSRTDAIPLVVCTGGEPMLQLDEPLIAAFHAAGFEVAVETNGTRPLVNGIDWVCVSPKAGAELIVYGGDEIKLVVPQMGIEPGQFEHLDFRHWYVQPMDGPDRQENTRWAIDWCLNNPRWRLSIQMHKLIGLR
jgi:7-carboxy-7-deazaguanine synthase